MRNMQFLVAVFALLSACSLAGAQDFAEDFESYAAGSEMHGQGGWKGWDNTPGAGAPASSEYAYSGTTSVEIIGTADLVHEFDIAGGKREFRIMQYIPSGTTGSTYFILLNSYDDGANQDWSVQWNMNLATGVLNVEQGGGSANIVYDQWVELKFMIDLEKNTVDEYYNGELISTHVWDDNNHGTIGAVDLYGNGASSVYYDDVSITQYFEYQAQEPDPADGALGVVNPLLRWASGDMAALHDVYFGTNAELTAADQVASQQPFNMYYHMSGLEPGTTYYWRVDEVEADGVTVHEGNVWSFTAMPLSTYAPSPADGAATSAQAFELGWLPGQGSLEQYHLYFGDNADDVAAGAEDTDKGELAEATFNTGLLRAGTTYYWRVDEADADGGTHVGDVWSFTTGQPIQGKVIREWWLGFGGTAVSSLTGDSRYPGSPDGVELVDLFEGPTNWADNYGSRLSGWLVAPESGDYTFWIASDDNSSLRLSTDADPANATQICRVPDWTASRVWTGFPEQESEPITLQAGQKYYIEALMKEGGGGDNIAVAWQRPGAGQEVISGAYVDTYALEPLHAAAPSPANGAADTVQTLTLSWFAGERAVQHDVYFGDDADAVAAADTATADIYQGRQTTAAFNPGALEWGKTYYWRVDEINTGDADSPWKGAVWSFSTADFIPVDDFESYSNDVGARAFEAWIDGVGFTLPEPGNAGNGTGAAVGHDIWDPAGAYFNGQIMETANVHGGEQAMPLYYDNTATPYYSEAEKTLAPARNWTVEGVEAVSLWFRGAGANGEAPLYVAITDNAGNVGVVVHPDPAAVQTANWTEWKIALSDLADAGVSLAAVRKIAVGVGSRTAPAADGSGVVYVDDVRVVKP